MIDQTLHDLIRDFMADAEPITAWLYGDVMHLYLRKTPRFVLGARRPCLDVANASINNPQNRRLGVFRALLTEVETYKFAVYVENVLDPWLVTFLDHRGYQCVTPEWPTSHVKLAAAMPTALACSRPVTSRSRHSTAAECPSRPADDGPSG